MVMRQCGDIIIEVCNGVSREGVYWREGGGREGEGEGKREGERAYCAFSWSKCLLFITPLFL